MKKLKELFRKKDKLTVEDVDKKINSLRKDVFGERIDVTSTLGGDMLKYLIRPLWWHDDSISNISLEEIISPY